MNLQSSRTHSSWANFRFTFAIASGLLLSSFTATAELSAEDAAPFYGAMLSAEHATVARLKELKAAGVNAIAIPIHNDEPSRASETRAFKRIQDAGLALCFWIEVARCPELAEAHPEWMASLQGHPEWRRLFKETPPAGEGEVAKTYPWVPILNKEPFAAQLSRITTLLKNRPTPKTIFLNDIQGAPSACGCGHHLCRWTSDYGKLRTTTPLGNRAPADFLTALKKLEPTVELVPVWTTECEKHDGDKDGLCHGVSCFDGICWKAWTEQLMPVVRQSRTLGVLLPYKEFQRDLSIYGPKAGWITHAVESFQTMPRRYQKKPIEPSQLLAVLQGWDVTDKEIAIQIDVAQAAGVQRLLVAHDKIDQGWTPQITKVR
ncbi:MAG: hypothetical protein AB8G99_25605 [Planctomycetaceae bacterium]